MQISRIKDLLRATPELSFAADGSPNPTAWAARVRATVRRLVASELILPLEEVQNRSARRGDLLVDELVLAGPGRPVIRGTLLRPQGGVRQAVLVCPGRNARLEVVTGASPPDYPDRDLAVRLAERGLATLTLDYGLLGSFDPERIAGRDEVNLLALAFGLFGRSPLAFLVEDALRALAWLRERPWISDGQVALAGHSLGGVVALHTALCNERPIPVAVASCLSSYEKMFLQRLSAGGAHALPGILSHADLPDLAAALAPCPLQIQHGQEDAILPLEDALSAMETVRASYAAIRAENALDLAMLTIGHGSDADRMAMFFHASFSRPAPRITVPSTKIVFDGRARGEILGRIDRALTSGVLTLGPYGERFEELAGQIAGAPAVAVNAGTSAVEIALRVIGVAGRMVLIPANTFFATAGAALHAGARIRFVDIELEGLGMDPTRLAETLDVEPDVAAVVIVHIGGLVSPSVKAIVAECERRGVALIEDAAHAHGSTLDGVPAGAFGRMSAFSMYPTKIVTSGEGGFIIAPRKDDREAARCLRDQGKVSFTANVHDRLGGNWRLSEIHASVGIAHLERLPTFLKERRRLGAWYDCHLGTIPGLRHHPQPPGVQTNYYKYVAILSAGIGRDELTRRLRDTHGVSLSGSIYDIPCCAQPFFGGAYEPSEFPNAYDFSNRHVCLPLYPTMSEGEQEAVIRALGTELGSLAAERATA